MGILNDKLLLWKMVVAGLLVAVCLSDLLLLLVQTENYADSQVLACVTMLIVSIFACLLQFLTHAVVAYHGATELLLFWLFRSFISVLYIRSLALDKVYDESSSELARFVLQVAILLLMCLLLLLESMPKQSPEKMVAIRGGYLSLNTTDSINTSLSIDDEDFPPVLLESQADVEEEEEEEQGKSKNINNSNDNNNSSNSVSKHVNNGSSANHSVCPEDAANVFSKYSFWWLNNLVAKGHVVASIQLSDVYPLPLSQRARQCAVDFAFAWRSQLKNKFTQPPAAHHDPLTIPHARSVLLKTAWACVGDGFIYCALLKLLQDMVPFLQPLILLELLTYLEDSGDDNGSTSNNNNSNEYEGYVLSVAMFLVALVQSLLTQQYFHTCFSTGVRLRTGLVTAIFDKAMRLSTAARMQIPSGQIVNLMSVDSQKMMDFVSFSQNTWSSPIVIILASFFLYEEIKAAVFVGVGLMLILMPMDFFVSRTIKDVQKAHLAGKDTRLKLLDELVTCIKIIKLYAWEKNYRDRLVDARDHEMGTLRAIFLRWAAQAVLWTSITVLTTVSSLGAFVLIYDEPLTPTKAFVSLALFNLLQSPLSSFPVTITSAIDAYVSWGRLSEYFAADEVKRDGILRLPTSSTATNSIQVTKATVAWPRVTVSETFKGKDKGKEKGKDKDTVKDNNNNSKKLNTENPFQLGPDLSFECPPASLVVVTGQVGSGKSMLLSGLLGELECVEGSIMIRGRVAYVPQQPYIMNASMKDNILFGLPLDAERYHSVLVACDLEPDMALLPAGDETEIGERGINLSGGQCQRVSLARAAYSQADIYLFDDPLSAVDRQVAAHIFANLIGRNGMLHDSTRVLVTHRLENLEQSDLLLVLKQGQIIEKGSYVDLISRTDGIFANLMNTYVTTVNSVSAAAIAAAAAADSGKDQEKSIANNSAVAQAVVAGKSKKKKEKDGGADGKLIKQEYRITGDVGADVYKAYISAVGNWRLAELICVLILMQATVIGSTIWLEIWSTADDNEGVDNVELYLSVFAALGVAQIILAGVQSLVGSIVCGQNAAQTLYKNMFDQLIHAKMSFFETTPLGRILNRFSKDVDVVDFNLPRASSGYLRQIFTVAGIFVAIVYAIPIFAPFVFVIAGLYWWMQRYFMPIKRDLKRLDSTLRSPTFAHFTETLQGLITIRAFRQQPRFVDDHFHHVNKQLQAYYYSITTNRWQGVRVDLLGSFVILISTIITVATLGASQAALAGLVITFALQLTSALGNLVRTSAETETHIVAVERIREYDSLPLEAPHEIPERKPSTSWPEKGAISYRNYSVRYREGLDLVLNDINLDIKAGEKIGVVGRTGSGKSTMLISLSRLIEPASGTILIDGVDITKIGLSDLRPRLAIITQNPILLGGNIRENVDPRNEYEDGEVWRVLACAQLDNFVRLLPNQLQHRVAVQGDNLSVGQRQLLCLARALLHNSRILLMDEATAAVDVETDDRIQKMIRSEFASCTVITIAHRLNTVLDADRIAVMSEGRIAELDSPSNLMANKDSIFSQLLRS